MVRTKRDASDCILNLSIFNLDKHLVRSDDDSVAENLITMRLLVKLRFMFFLGLVLACPVTAAPLVNPLVGDFYSEFVPTEMGYQIPLPPGKWEVTAIRVREEPKINTSTTKHVVLKNLDSLAAIPYLVVRYATVIHGTKWASNCANIQKFVYDFSLHGTQLSQKFQKCQKFWTSSLPNSSRDEWWQDLQPGFYSADPILLKESYTKTYFVLFELGGDWVYVDVFARPSKSGFSAKQIEQAARNGEANAWMTSFKAWSEEYFQALDASVFQKRPVAISAFTPPINGINPPLVALSIQTVNSGATNMAANSIAKEDPKLTEEKRLAEERRVDEEKRNKEGHELAVAEAKQKESLRLSAGVRAKEELRLVEDKRLAEEKRLAEDKRRKEEQEGAIAEAKQKEQLRLAAEAKTKEDQRLAEEKRSVEDKRRKEEQERAIAEAKQKEQLRLAAEAKAKDEMRLGEEKRLAEDKRRKDEQERAIAEAKQKELLRIAEVERLNLEKKAREQALENQRLLAEVARLQAEAEKNRQQPELMANRKALVIGNNKYKFVSPLATAAEDAKTIADNLAQVGYKVTLKLDASEREMRAAIRNFSSQVEGGDEVAFYFAGHGVQIGSANYLIPVDVSGESEAQIRDEAVALQRILDEMTERKAKFTLAVIDACRDNPFKVVGRNLGSALRGLAPTSAATGQMVIFSAGSGQKALDSLGPSDKSKNGVFTRVFVKQMQKPAVSIDKILKDTRSEVVNLAKTIGHEQVPAIYDQVIGEFFFKK